jgi:hypothetical protein
VIHVGGLLLRRPCFAIGLEHPDLLLTILQAIHTALPVRYAIHMQCVSYREACQN